ncbi:MAG: glutathione-regulated potassium-efflux system protein KefB [Hyphomicrobiaceae bacterium]|nr:glutathione-regulated potassium-efflux system protein KefB [Hyphomicrobiaceae bacterium]
MTLGQIAMLLAAAAVAAPLAKALRIGTVLGYILAGVLIGPHGLGRLAGLGISETDSVKEVLHIAEFGVVLLLFLIGLELRLQRLWTMRAQIFGAGGVQVVATGLALGLAARGLGIPFAAAMFIGLALSLSSTAFALQVLEENGELTQRHGRLAFAILLFQDLAAIPLIALATLLGGGKGNVAQAMDWVAVLKATAAIVAVVIGGRTLVDMLFRFVAATRVKEALTAAALLVVLLVVLAMEKVGLSASLGAFLAGVVLADSAYRHQIEADIRPFEGLLLGLFFTAIGMSLDLRLILAKPHIVLALVAGMLIVKAAILWAIGRSAGLGARPARRLALSISQGGEFAFVLLSAGVASRLLAPEHAALGAVIVTVSMMVTPAGLMLEQFWTRFATPQPLPVFDALPENEGHVIVAGFGRFGQVVCRVLRARKIPFTALDVDPVQIELVKRFGAKTYFGDASRLDILEAAQAEKAQAFVLAIDDVEASMRTAEMVRRHFPSLSIYARARNRNHAHRLMALGVSVVQRETFLSSLELTRHLLRGLGVSKAEAQTTLDIFRSHDEDRLRQDFGHLNDRDKLLASAREAAAELEQLLDADAVAQAVSDGTASPMRTGVVVQPVKVAE